MAFTKNLQILTSILSSDFLIESRYDIMNNLSALNTYATVTSAGLIQLAPISEINTADGFGAISPNYLSNASLEYPLKYNTSIVTVASLGGDVSNLANVEYVNDVVDNLDLSGNIHTVFGRFGPTIVAVSGDYDADKIDETTGRKFIDEDQKDAITGANSPSSTNVFVTSADITPVDELASGLIDLGDTDTGSIGDPISFSNSLNIASITRVYAARSDLRVLFTSSLANSNYMVVADVIQRNGGDVIDRHTVCSTYDHGVLGFNIEAYSIFGGAQNIDIAFKLFQL